MEISKGLQQEIQSVQSKLKNAIRDHQICVGKLKDDPDNSDILGLIQEIQLNIISLGRCQKQVVQRLRKEVEAFKADNANDVKLSFASLLGLNNNNHITANNEATADEISEVKVVTNGLDVGRHAKEDYEDIVRNGDVITPPRENLRNKNRSVSVETLSAEDEIMEVEVDDDSRETRRQDSEERFNERKVNSTEQLNFLEILGLITTSRFTDLQNRRAERKRRSTANPQFVYSNWEIPTKRKRHNYLQSAGNVPQTRQTTARLNGPSPPPGTNNKPTSTVAPPKSTSPPTRTIVRSFIPTQKATTRPNILRNMSESRVFVNKGRVENGNGQLSSGAKSSQQSNSKTVLIPGLPSGLTIERIENDTAVCINCRNPGTLTNCDNCDANYHVSCHLISPPPPRLCPKCALRLKDETSTTIKKNDELVAASYAPGVAGKAGEDPEIDKASCGLYKIGTTSKSQQINATGRAVNQLPSSTVLIPISPNAIAATSSVNQSDLIVDEQSIKVIEPDSDSNATAIADSNELSYNTSLVIGNQYSRSGVTYVPQPESNVSYSYHLPCGNISEIVKQPYFIVKKIAKSGNQPIEQTTEEKVMQISKNFGRSDGGEANLQLEKITGRLAESLARGWKKSATRAIPGLNRIVHTDNKSYATASEHSNDNDMDKLSCSREQQSSETLGRSREFSETTDIREASRQIEQKDFLAGGKHGSLLNAMLTGYHKPDNVTDSCDKNDLSGRESNGKSHRSDITGSAEHVKLEEAHLSAPLRAKLVRDDDIVNVRKTINETKAGIMSGRRRTTEDRGRTPPLQRAFFDGSKIERKRQLPLILMRPVRKSLDSRDNEIAVTKSSKLDDNLDFASFETKYSKIVPDLNSLPEAESSTDTSATETDEEQLSPRSRSIRISRRVRGKGKPENIERKDLSGEERDKVVRIDEREVDTDEELAEEIDDEDEDLEDSPILDDDITVGTINGCGINTVSPESMQVLEQFESAILNVDSGDITANP